MPDALATLSVPVDTAIAALRAMADAIGMRRTETTDRFELHFSQGDAIIWQEAGQARLTLTAVDAAALQLVRDTVVERVDTKALGLTWDTPITRGYPVNMSVATLTEVRQLTPNFMRLVMEGDDMARFAEGALHFRLLLGPDGAGFPMVDENGVTDWPGGVGAWHRPVLTSRAIEVLDGTRARISFDVFLHEGGRSAEWARRAAPGDEVAFTGPTGGRGPKPAAFQALVGDETALPVIARILRELPADTLGHAVLFTTDPADEQALNHPEGVRIDWQRRDGSATLVDAVKAMDLPAEDRFVFAAGEKGEATTVREWLLEQGWDKSSFQTATYWTA